MEIKVRGIPEKLWRIIKDEKSIIDFYWNLAVTIQKSNTSYADAKAISPIVFIPVIENMGVERYLVLENGEVIREEPILVSLISKNGEPFVDKVKRDKMVSSLADGIKSYLEKNVDVEIEFINELGIFIYVDGKAIN